MKRRKFIKTSSLISLPLILKSCDWGNDESSYPIQVDSDAGVGHLLMKSRDFEQGAKLAVETLIVGGGIAGMSAAAKMKGQDFLVCELSEALGGTSSASTYKGTTFARGAHYELEYPNYYGEEVIEFLEGLEVLKFQPWKQSWGFKDQKYIILHRRKNQCFDHGAFRSDVLQEGVMKNSFLEFIQQYDKAMPLPTRLITEETRALNALSFSDLLGSKLSLDDSFMAGLDYHMKDDYGAGASEVSALAGIHYFMCRPYYKEVVELFSPPSGNYYFIDKMKKGIPAEQILTNHLIKSVTEKNGAFEVQAIDIQNRQIKTITTRKVVYAGQKHALKYIYPEGYELFKNSQYAPWMVVNIVTDNTLPTPGHWQNEMLTDDTSFLGFVDSATQNTGSSKSRVLTAYYCLPAKSREDLIHVKENKEPIAQKTIDQISAYFGKDITSAVQKVFIKVMGHAMPIPAPGYLFDDKNQYRKNKNLVYAGVDNSRLPLLAEAVDSGLEAVRLLNEQ